MSPEYIRSLVKQAREVDSRNDEQELIYNLADAVEELLSTNGKLGQAARMFLVHARNPALGGVMDVQLDFVESLLGRRP